MQLDRAALISRKVRTFERDPEQAAGSLPADDGGPAGQAARDMRDVPDAGVLHTGQGVDQPARGVRSMGGPVMGNVLLAEAKADARDLAASVRDHPHHCHYCQPRKPCQELREMRADLARMRLAIRTWFDPGPDQGTLL